MVFKSILKQWSLKTASNNILQKGGCVQFITLKTEFITSNNTLLPCQLAGTLPSVPHAHLVFFFFQLRAKMLCRTKHTSSLYRTLVEVHTLSLYRTLCRTHTLSPYRTRCIPFGRKEQLGWDSMEKVLIWKIRKSMWGGWVGWGTHFM